MSGISINDAIGAGQKMNMDMGSMGGQANMGDFEQQQIPNNMGMEQPRSSISIPEWVKAETGEGSVGEYIEHAMNPMQSKGIARMLRGFTGLFGSLNFALIDIVMGAMEFSKEKKGVVKQ